MSPLCMNEGMRTTHLSVRSYDICNLTPKQSVVRNIQSTATRTSLRNSLIFFFRLLLAASDDVLLDCSFMQGTKHAKTARKKTNKKLLHTIQTGFKYVCYMSQVFTKHINRRTMRK